MTIKKITVPDLGEASEVEVIELLVNVGEKVKENDSLLVLESDKAAMEIPAPFSGIVKEISMNLVDQVTTGSDILTLEIDNEKEDSPVLLVLMNLSRKIPKSQNISRKAIMIINLTYQEWCRGSRY